MSEKSASVIQPLIFTNPLAAIKLFLKSCCIFMPPMSCSIFALYHMYEFGNVSLDQGNAKVKSEANTIVSNKIFLGKICMFALIARFLKY